MKETEYRRLSIEEREEISRYLSQKKSIRWIARQIGRSPSTVSRDILAGGSDRWMYRAARAQKRAFRNARKRKFGRLKLLMNARLRQEVHQRLRLHWSPEQIVESLKRLYGDSMRLTPRTIYSYLYVLPRGRLRTELTRCLRRRHWKRHKRIHKGLGGMRMRDMISIEKRPKEVADRIVPGHWEGDLVVGRNRRAALGSLVERSSRAVILVPLNSFKATDVRKAFAREALKLPRQMRLTLTYDQGSEMQQHRLFTKNTRMKVYFAHPASPWERATNENTNGLIRDFFPKGTDLSRVSRQKVKRVQHLLNGRPRKILNFETPYEAYKKLAGVALDS